MAIKEELVVEARAETSNAEKGLADLTRAAEALAAAEEEVAKSSDEAAKGADDAADAAKKAAKDFEGAGKKADDFADGMGDAAKEAAGAKTHFGAAGSEAGKAGDKFSSASGDARKFSDMLREVADDADKAAGSIAQGLGGPGFIKALGGAGIAFGVAKAGVEAFADSSEKLFQSYGEEGRVVWEDLEKKMFSIKGAFAAAVLGGNDLNENAKRMNLLLEGTKTVVDGLLSPIRLFTEGLWAMADGTANLTEQQKRNLDIENRYQTAMRSTADAARDEKESYEELLKVLGDVVETKEQAAAREYNNLLASIDARIENNRELKEFRANAAADAAAARAEEAEIASGIKNKWLQARRDITSDTASRRVAMMTTEERARELLLADQEFQKQLRISTNAAREQAYRDAAVATQEEKDRENELLLRREIFVQKAAELEYLLWNPPKPASTGTTRPPSAARTDKELTDEEKFWRDLAKVAADGQAAYLKSVAQGYADVVADFRKKEKEKLDAAKAADDARWESALNAARKITKVASDAAEAEKKHLEDIKKAWKSFGDSAKSLGLQNLQDALANIGTTLGQTAAAGGDFASAIGDTMEALVGQIAGQWGDLFLKQGIGMMFLDPVAGAGLLAAGVGLKALAGFMSGGDTATDQGSAGANGVQQSAPATTAVARPEASFGYFEGGRSPVTIVTNDAASIRTMQNRLNLVAARGGSGV